MIYGNLSDLPKYLGIHKNMDTAIRYIQEHDMDLRFLNPGRNEVDGDNVFINAFHYTTAPQEELSFEAHNAYADIHILRSGTECIGVSPVSDLVEFERDNDSDYVGYRGDVQCLSVMNTDKFLIAFPEDPHMVKIANKAPSFVEKAVVKVKIY